MSIFDEENDSYFVADSTRIGIRNLILIKSISDKKLQNKNFISKV